MQRLAALLLLSALTSPPAAMAAEPADIATIEACLKAKPDTSAIACVGPISEACEAKSGGETTMGTNNCIARESDAWDAILNEAYTSETASAKETDGQRKAAGDEDASAAAGLLKAQRAWIAYRDAECDRRFELYEDGTIRTTISVTCIRDLTAQRALDLRPQM